MNSFVNLILNRKNRHIFYGGFSFPFAKTFSIKQSVNFTNFREKAGSFFYPSPRISKIVLITDIMSWLNKP